MSLCENCVHLEYLSQDDETILYCPVKDSFFPLISGCSDYKSLPTMS